MGRDCSRLIANCNACSFPHSPQLVSPGVHLYDKLQISARFPRRGVKFEKQSKHGERQSYNFRAYHSFGNSYHSCITTVNAEFIRTIHPAFIPVTRPKCSYGKNFQPAAYRDQGGNTEIWETEPARPLTWTQRKFYSKDSEVRRDLGNRTNPVKWAYWRGPNGGITIWPWEWSIKFSLLISMLSTNIVRSK